MIGQFPKLRFSQNWNQKLNNKIYTTIRPWVNTKLYPSSRVEVYLNEQYQHDAVCLFCQGPYSISTIPDHILWLDMGDSPEKARKILDNMVKHEKVGVYYLLRIEK